MLRCPWIPCNWGKRFEVYIPATDRNKQQGNGRFEAEIECVSKILLISSLHLVLSAEARCIKQILDLITVPGNAFAYRLRSQLLTSKTLRGGIVFGSKAHTKIIGINRVPGG
jgi:hypothetical protein